MYSVEAVTLALVVLQVATGFGHAVEAIETNDRNLKADQAIFDQKITKLARRSAR